LITLYGEPDKLETGDTTFVNPYIKHHYGYDVIRATWLNADVMRIKVNFVFQGSKGIYFLFLGVSYTDRNSKD
jgi:hypothetical protein